CGGRPASTENCSSSTSRSAKPRLARRRATSTLLGRVTNLRELLTRSDGQRHRLGAGRGTGRPPLTQILTLPPTTRSAPAPLGGRSSSPCRYSPGPRELRRRACPLPAQPESPRDLPEASP